jgi:Ca-activated chloride channel family protein
VPVAGGQVAAKVDQFALTETRTTEDLARRRVADVRLMTPGDTGVATEDSESPGSSVEAVQRLLRERQRELAEAQEHAADLEVPDAVEQEGFDREAYARIVDNPFIRPQTQAKSTFSIDVDTAGYANVRRIINQGTLPPPDAVRIEELLNYFNYEYPAPAGEHPIAVSTELGPAPWAPDHRLVRVGVRAKDIDFGERPATNLVFLIDVSGSMNQPNKLPLLKQSMKMLVDRLTPDDRVAMVVYAGAAGLVLDSTYCYRKQEILDAIERLSAGGSTNGGAGIQLAYSVARAHFIEGGVNRVILATDGDLNVGATSEGELVRLIEEQRRSGVELTVLGFGTGNYQDSKLESLSNAGNGNFAYIDTAQEARKVLVEELGGTLVTVARDVKIQVDFNPMHVGAYRLIGYENRLMATQDFRDDTKDAGEIGAGHTVTALYEIMSPEKADAALPPVEPSKYQGASTIESPELLTVFVRYKPLDRDEGVEFAVPVVDDAGGDLSLSDDFHFASAVAAFGMVLRGSPHRGHASLDMVLELAGSPLRDEATEAEPPAALREGTYRADFVELVRKAQSIER